MNTEDSKSELDFRLEITYTPSMQNQKVKIVVISDTHGFDFISLIPECDILCICGDISPVKMPHDVASQRGWFRKRFISQLVELKKKCGSIVFIAGNHSTYFFDCFQRNNNSEIQKQLPDGCFYLCNDSVTINGLKIYGNPWCNAPKWAEIGPPVWNFATFNKDFLSELYAGIPSDVDIILTHGPAYGYCDQILDENLLVCAFDKYKDSLKAEHLGCTALAKRIKELSDNNESKLKLVASGHLHSADHLGIELGNTKFYGVSILDERYQLGNYSPLVLEV